MSDSNVYVHLENKHMEIKDIKSEGERVNRGYESNHDGRFNETGPRDAYQSYYQMDFLSRLGSLR